MKHLGWGWYSYCRSPSARTPPNHSECGGQTPGLSAPGSWVHSCRWKLLPWARCSAVCVWPRGDALHRSPLSAPWEAGLYLLHPRAPLLLLRVGFWQGDGVGPGGLEGIAAGGLSLSPSPLGCPPLRSRFSSNFLDPSVPCRPPPSHLVGSGAHDSQPASSSLPGWFPLACPSLCPVSLSIPVRMARTLPRPQ